MGRKNTVWGARHVSEEQEINRLINLASTKYKIKLNKLEASALMAEKSKRGVMKDSEVLGFIQHLRGIGTFEIDKGGLFDV